MPFAEATTSTPTTPTNTDTESRQDIYNRYGIRSCCSQDAVSSSSPSSASPSSPLHSMSSERSDDSDHTSVETMGSNAQGQGLVKGLGHSRRFEYGESPSSSKSALSHFLAKESGGGRTGT